MIAALQPLARRRRTGGIAPQPPAHIVVIELLAPQQPREGLAHDIPTIRGKIRGDEGSVKLVRFLLSLRKDPVEAGIKGLTGRSQGIVGQSQSHRDVLAGSEQ